MESTRHSALNNDEKISTIDLKKVKAEGRLQSPLIVLIKFNLILDISEF